MLQLKRTGETIVLAQRWRHLIWPAELCDDPRISLENVDINSHEYVDIAGGENFDGARVELLFNSQTVSSKVFQDIGMISSDKPEARASTKRSDGSSQRGLVSR